MRRGAIERSRKRSDPIEKPVDHALLARRTSPFLTAKEAAFHLRIAAVTLKKLRRLGTGLLCRMHGGCSRYHIDDIEKGLREHSTSGGNSGHQ